MPLYLFKREKVCVGGGVGVHIVVEVITLTADTASVLLL